MNAADSPHPFIGRSARAGILGGLGKPVFRWMALFLLLAANLPMFVAGSLAFLNFSGDHEIRFGFGENRMEITLHHQQVPSHSAHRHTLLETILIGESASDGEPDHHIGIARESVVVEEVSQEQNLTDSAGLPSLGSDIAEFRSMLPVAVSDNRPLQDQPGFLPQRLMWRGLVMRI